MLATSLIRPHPVLNDFIYNYTLCKSGSANIKLAIPCFANHETSLCFFLTDTPTLIKNTNTKNVTEKTDKISLIGLLTHFKGTMRFDGNCNEFIVEFKPNGFNKMFGIPAYKICDNIFPANEIIGKCVTQLYEKLLDATDVQEMVSFADKFLIGILNKQKTIYMNEGITRISHQLSSNLNTIKISQYACQANMSIRNFERRFSEQVGTSPKLFCKLLRFNAAVKYRMSHPQKSWYDIAFESDYYDNMHMIKEFKQFANASPAILFNDNPCLTEERLPNWNG